MKRNVFNLMISTSLLLGLGGCGSEQLAPEQEKPTPVVPTPDEKGLVTLQFNVSSSGYEDGVPESRGAEAPVTFTQELGDGYVLESTLTPSPRTRAAGDPLREGTTVMIFTMDPDNNISTTSFQIQAVGANGVLSFSVPEGVTSKLMFFTLGNEAIFTRSHIGTWVMSTSQIPASPVIGQVYPCVTRFRDSSFNSLSSLFNPSLGDDAMLAVAGPIDTDNLAAMNPRISFNHLFSRLTWNVTVDASADETIGLVRAGFYPRSLSGSFMIGSYMEGNNGIDAPSEIYGPLSPDGDNNAVSGYNPPADNTFITPANWSPDAEFSQSVCFQRPAVWGSDYPAIVMKIAIDSLTINNPTGDVTYQDQVITLTGPTSFENGKEYTVNSRITKRLTWATSNIYWDGAKLTFDADAANGGVAKGVPSVTTANSPYYQGVFFKWGSLVGIAPVGDAAAFSNTTVVYKPNTPTSAGYSSGYTSTTIASGVWGEILMFIPPSAPGSGNYFLPHKAVLDQGTYFGDICAYITGGVWRIPTSVETTSYYGGYCYRNEPAVGWWIPNMPENGASWSSITVPNNSDSRAGKYSFVARPDNVFRLKTRWGQVVSLPPGGSRTMNNLQSPGRSGNYLFGNSRYLSSRTYSYTTFNGIGADNSAYMASQPFSQNGNAYAVRCVK